MATRAYDADAITVLEGLEPVRKRPGMYIGGTGKDGLHHLVREIVDNAVDEAMNGHASRIEVAVSADLRTVTVTDDGRGIPVAIHPKTGKPALETILCTLHAGGKFEEGAYKTAGGLHGVGSSVVNALSVSLEATVRRDGFEWRMAFRRGAPRGPIEQVRPHKGHGTTIRFTPDPEIFGDPVFDPDTIREHLQTASFLHKGLRIVFSDGSTGRKDELHHPGGVVDFLAHLVETGGAARAHEAPFVLERPEDPRLEVALCWTDSPREVFRSFANGIPTRDGGTHEQGLKDGLVKALRNVIEAHEAALPRGLKLSAEDIREGVVAVASVFVGDPQFQGQTKDRLNNPEIRAAVESAVRVGLERFFTRNPKVTDAVLARAVLAARARQASRAATEEVRRKSPTQRRLALPGKLADCSLGDAARTELFIVEGDSAGGSAKQGRDRTCQAILPLRGKVLNAEVAGLDKVFKNAELTDIVQALGCGMGKDFDPGRLRYGKVILLMDADSDGAHIATLLLTFFYRFLRPLVDAGHVYLAQPPLFRVDAGKQTWWARDERERDRILAKLPPRAHPEVSRFKGLGEMMPRTLFETTLDPRRRRLLQVRIPEGAQLETDRVINDLMGRDASTRYREITEWMALVDDVDA